ncbi:MAG TPA: hypothetical protein VM619_03500 [Luteimonas sp.]|nr:hypothetical protein [Luteimonas sp.]
MDDQARYSIDVVAADQQQIDLLECLVRIDRGESLDGRAAGLRDRLVDAGLVDEADGVLRLTPAGIERCRSLQYRIASDREAAKVLAERGLALVAAQNADP